MKQATNASSMRLSNRKLILNLIRLKPISRAEIADITRLTRASVTMIVDELMEAGLVETSCAEENSALGRKRTLLKICPDARFCFGVSVSRRECRVGVVDLCGKVLREESIGVQGRAARDVLQEVCNVIAAQRKQMKLQASQILGIGVSIPGPVDYQKGVLLSPPHFEAWKDTPVAEILREETGFETLVEKDTNARVLEEKYFGLAREISNFMLVQIDDGVGSGVMIHDRLYRGSRGLGTEIGHTTIRYDGPLCSCGNRGCLENYLRVPSLLENTPFSTWPEAADSIGEEAQAVMDRAAEYLGAALVNAINLYDLQQVILSGEVAQNPGALLTRLNQNLSQRVLSRSSVSQSAVIAAGEVLPVRTGAMAVLHDFFEERI